MIRFIIRHSKADPYSPTGSDDDRPLTDKGHAQAEYLAQTLATHDNPPARIIASPITRAQQTAAHIAEALSLDIDTDAALSTHAYISEAEQLLDALLDPQPIALVGHNPTLSILATDRTASSISLKTGMCVVLEFDPNRTHAALLDLIRMPKAHSG